MAKTKDLLEKLDRKIDEVKNSDEFKKMLKFFSKFHQYSYHNTILIQLQKPDATHVAGYRQWQKKFNRQVKKGEEGIAILAPFTYKKKEEDNDNEKETTKTVTKTYFRPVYVFDISQTEGPPPPVIDTKIEDSLNELLEPLTEFTKKQGIKLVYKKISGYTDGYSTNGAITIDKSLNDTEKVNVIIHELAHEILHYGSDKLKLTKEIKEMEAEAVSFVVLDHYGIKSKSEKYLAFYKKSYDLKESLNKISKVSAEIIDFCDSYFETSDIKQII